MQRDQPDKVLLVCKWKGREDRFFGKYKSFETGKWVKIPGGVFPPPFDTKEKARIFAEEWYAQASGEHEARRAAAKPAEVPTWDAICDAYIAEVRARMRGKASTRHEAITITNANIRKGMLAARDDPSRNDESRCVEWLRSLARQNIAKGDKPPRTRKPMTVRNIAKHLRYLFRVALRKGLIAGMSSNPTAGDEFRDELKALVATQEPREWLLPIESFGKLVSCAAVPTPRRIAYLVLGLTGLRPGELAGLQLCHLTHEGEIPFFSVEQQYTLARSKAERAGPGIDTPKTKWARRNVPAHRALRGAIAAWTRSGWQAWVGRAWTPDDFAFPNCDGKPHREEHGDTFRADLEAAGCPTTYAGAPLTLYALRHLFSTLLTEGHAHDAAHTRLMGHRPKDTKTLNYSAKLLPFLAAEVERIAFELPADAPAFGAPTAASYQPGG